MAGGVEGAAHGGDIRLHSRGGLVVGDEHGLDRVVPVGGQRFGEAFGRQASPRRLDHADIEPVASGHVDPAMAEHAVAGGKHRIALAQGVRQGRLPAAGRGGGKHEDLRVGRLQHRLHAGQRRLEDLPEQR